MKNEGWHAEQNKINELEGLPGKTKKKAKFYLNPVVTEVFALWCRKFQYFSVAAKGSHALKKSRKTHREREKNLFSYLLRNKATEESWCSGKYFHQQNTFTDLLQNLGLKNFSLFFFFSFCGGDVVFVCLGFLLEEQNTTS